MASSELDWTDSQSYELDRTDTIADREEDEEDRTDTIADREEDEEGPTEEGVSMDADRTDERTSNKLPQSEIVVRTISVERSAMLADLPIDADAAFGQWLGNSGLAPSKH